MKGREGRRGGTKGRIIEDTEREWKEVLVYKIWGAYSGTDNEISVLSEIWHGAY